MAENVENVENVVGDTEPPTESVSASEQLIPEPPTETETDADAIAPSEFASSATTTATEADADVTAPSEFASSATTTATEADAESAATAPSEPTKPRRSVSTRKLFAGAIVLGIVGGVAGGFTIQAMRRPTPLPPLAVTQPVYPRGPIFDGTRPPALPASQDDATIVNGDLTKLLLPTPAGATASFYDHEWVELSQDAADCTLPANCLANELDSRLVRIAATTWTQGDGLFIEIRMYQHLPGHFDAVATDLASAKGHSNALTLPDSVVAAGYEFVASDGYNDDFAVAVHGDLAVDFWVTSKNHVPDPSIISKLITQQMARL
jgi:hypothetical protein